MAGQEQIYQEAMNQGHSAAWDQEWDKAADYYRKAVEEIPDQALGLTSLGLALFELQKYDEAQAQYGRAAKITPDDPLPVEKIAEIFERIGNQKSAAEHSLTAADLWLKLKDADKAIENWTRVTRLYPEHLKAHSRLAVVHERLGHNDQAVRSYINVASLLQDGGQVNEAMQAVQKAIDISPDHAEARQALELVRSNKTLPKPRRPHAGTGTLRMAVAAETEAMKDGVPDFSADGPDPYAEARQHALAGLAEILFDASPDDVDAGGMGAVFGSGGEPEFATISMHVGAAIDAQTRGDEKGAAKDLEKAIKTGLNFPAAYYNLGMLYYKMDKTKDAVRYLQSSVKHPDFALAARLMTAEIYQKAGRPNDAVEEYLEALREADAAVVSPDQVDELREQYDPYIETIPQKEDEEELANVSKTIADMLLRPGWRQHLSEIRQQLPGGTLDGPAVPLAEMLTEAQNSEIVEMISYINSLARQGFVRSAMEEAFMVMSVAPTYLPLHIQMGELLIRQNNIAGAIAKFLTVAQMYASRGEAKRATDLLRRIVQISPMDISARNRLIRRLIEQGQVNQAIVEYISLADVYYRLAQLTQARATYEEALRLAQQSNADQVWSVRVLKYMADIDIQKLEWRQALRVYEQLRTLSPEDEETRQSLIELNVRMGQIKQANVEVDNYISYLSGMAKDGNAVAFLEKLVKDNQDQVFARRKLAEMYQQAARPIDALEQWDKVAELLVAEGDNEQAKEAIRAILMLNPPNSEQYRALLQKLG